jgi:hypothetical protein
MLASTYFDECNATFPCALDPANLIPMNLDSTDWNSIYIPVIPKYLSLTNSLGESHRFHVKYLSYFFEKLLQLGKVSRVDFIDRILIKGQVPVKAAFIHFEYWYDNQNARNLRHTLNSSGSGRIGGYEYAPSRMQCGFRVLHRPGYIDININHKPIENAECDRNIHQLREDNRLLELELIARNNHIAELDRHLADAISMMGRPPVYHYSMQIDNPSTDMNQTVYPRYNDYVDVSDDEDHRGSLTVADLGA